MPSKGPNQKGFNATPYHDQLAFNFTTSQAATSYAGSMSNIRGKRLNRDEDEQSRASVYTSYAETQEDQQVRREGGRVFNMLSETYSIPTEIEEWERLDKQHRAITLGLGGLYPAPEIVRTILAPQDGVTKRIIDLGCGTGIWSTEMAVEFPHCEVLGIDLAPVPIQSEGVPSNCRFEMDDINRGLSHLHGQFDVVFARAIGMGLKDFRRSLADIEACAKPGGIIIFIDGDFDVYSGYPMTYRPFWSESNPDGSYMTRVIYEIRRISSTLLSSDVRAMEKIIDEGFWAHATLLDPATCKAGSLYLPIGAWCEVVDDHEERPKYIGTLMRQDITEGAGTSQPLIMKCWSKEESDRWAAGMREECEKDTLGIRLRLAWGRRRQSPNLPAPEIAPMGEAGSRSCRCHLYEIFDTPEQAVAAAAIRNRGKDIPVPPLPSAQVG